MKTLFILSCVIFVISVFIIGCGDEQNLPISPEEQAFMAPSAQGKGNNGNQGNGNSYGHDKIVAINTSSEKVVLVPEIAVEKSPNLANLDEVVINEEEIDIIIQVDETTIYVSLNSDSTFDSFYENFKKLLPNKKDIDISYSEETTPPTIKITGINPSKIIIMLGMMTDVDAYSNSF